MKLHRVIPVVIAGLVLCCEPTHAIVSSVVLAQPIAQGAFTDGAGDQVSKLVTTPKAIYALGTVEGAPTDWISQPSLGGSDGFIASFSYTGQLNWSLRLGTAKDDIATAGIISKTGDIWLAGVSAPQSELTELTIWRISQSGKLLDSFHTTAPGIIYPHSMSEGPSGLSISGVDFAVTLSMSGNFGAMTKTTFKELAHPTTFVGSTYSWKKYTGRGPVLGVPTFKPKSAKTLYYKYLNSTKSVKAAYEVSTPPALIAYQKNVGLILLSEVESGFSLTVLK